MDAVVIVGGSSGGGFPMQIRFCHTELNGHFGFHISMLSPFHESPLDEIL